ncbi:MAG: TonB-dependent receptor plug domain-containing protein [Gemmatimonadota bacterium]
MLRCRVARRAMVAGFTMVAGRTVSASPGWAQAPSDSLPADTAVIRVEGIRVEAPRPISTSAGVSAVRLTLDSPRVPPAAMLEDVLRELPFAQVRENSRGEAQLRLRGAGSRQIAVLVDGVPLTLGWDDRTDLSVIPVGAAHEVQLFRGLSSVLHGPNVLGGVVELDISRGRPSEEPPVGLEAGLDDTGADAVGGEIARGFSVGDGELLLRAGGGYRSRPGVALPSGVRERVRTEDGLRLNSDLGHANGFLSVRYRSGSGSWFSLSSFGFRAHKGVPPELHLENPRLWRIPETARSVTAVSAGTGWRRTPLGEGDLELSLGLDFSDQEIDAYETLAYERIVDRELDDDRTVSLRLVGDHTLGAGTVRTAVTYADTRHLETLGSAGPSRFRQRLWSVGAEIEQPVPVAAGTGFFSRPALTVGASVDGSDTPRTGGRGRRDPIAAWGARAGASVLLGGGSARLHAGISRRVRFPSLRELYSGALGKFVPNPALAPERLRILETGVTGRIGHVDGQLVLFRQTLSDAIVRTGLGGGQFIRENRARIRASGVEMLAALAWGRVAVEGDLTLQDVSLRDPRLGAARRRAEYQPEVSGSIELSAATARAIRGRLKLDYVGRQYCVDPDRDRDLALDPSARAGFELTRLWKLPAATRGVETTVALANLTDAAVYDQCGLPQPGRVVRLQVRIR